MTGAFAKALAVVLAGAALTGCNTATTDLSTDDETTALGPARCPAGEVVGAGTTASHSALDDVGQSYGARCENRANIRYTPTGAGPGVAAFLAGDTDWASSDQPLTDDQLAAARTRCVAGEGWSLPLIAAPVAIAYHLPGIDDLTLDAPTLAGIFDGRIGRWNDPAIARLNPARALPDAPITVVGRSDADTTTRALTGFLVAAGGWPDDRAGDQWPGVGEKQDRSGLLGTLRGTPNAIGYTGLAQARDNGLSVVRIDSGSGPVAPSPESGAAALDQAELTGESGRLRLTPRFTDVPAGAYPVVGIDYQLVCSKGLTKAKTQVLKDFLGFVASDPQQAALGEIGYAPIPVPVRERIRAATTQVQ